MDKRYFSEKIVKWYQSNSRKLPWRETSDPYKVWLSEIILQQTRVNQGLPYYERFVSRYPDVKALAAASEQDVLMLWQGLGYYTRARNLHLCARTVVTKHGGQFPSSYKELLELPGIGEYTAAAIASIVYKEKVAVVDGNVFRVLSRLFGIETAINSPEGKNVFVTLANQLIGEERPDLHNQAVMEFGALWCTPKNPRCESCTFQKSCTAFSHNLQAVLPLKLKGKSGRKRYFYYLVMESSNQLLMKKRDEKDIWLGLFDFQLIEKERPVKIDTILDEEPVKKIIGKADHIQVTKRYKHILTHQTIFSRFIIVKNRKKPRSRYKNQSFYSMKEIAALPKPVLVSRFLNDHYVL